MEEATEYTTLVVSEREFLVNRKELVEKSTYFKAMLEGSFVEAGLNRIKLTSIQDPEAFAVMLEYILAKRISLKAVLKVLRPVLVLADMMNEDTFLKFLRKQLLKNWSSLENAQVILQFGEALGFTTSLFRHIFETLTLNFLFLGTTENYETKDSVIHNSSGLVVDICGAEIATFYSSPDEFSALREVVNGIAKWIVKQKIDEIGIRKVVRCLGVQNLDQKHLLNILPEHPESTEIEILKMEINNCVHDAVDIFRKHVSRVTVGWAFEIPVLFYFNIEKWAWNPVDLINRQASPSDERNLQTDNAEEPLRYSVWYSKSKDFLSTSCTEGPSNEPFYCSTWYLENNCNTLTILELKSGENRFSTVFKTPIAEDIKGCSLCRVNDVIHGFISHIRKGVGLQICYFTLQRNREDDTWCNSEFHLEPLLYDSFPSPIPVATISSEGGILVMFQCDLGSLWVTLYNVQSRVFQPLVFLPKPPQPDTERRIEMFENDVSSSKVSSGAVFDDSSKRACTFLVCCCNSRNSCQVFQLSSVTEPTRGLICAPLLNKKCSKEDHSHIPLLKRVVHVCSYSS